jgi:hypothetical protein
MEQIAMKTQELVDLHPCALIRVDLGIHDMNEKKDCYDLPDDDFHKLYTYLHTIRLKGAFASWEHEELYHFQNKTTCMVRSNRNFTGPKGFLYTCYRFIELYKVNIRSNKSSVVFRYRILLRQIVPGYLQTDVYTFMECRMHHKLVHHTECVNVNHHFYVKWKGKCHSECEQSNKIFHMYMEIKSPLLFVQESVQNIWIKMQDLEGHPNEDTLFVVDA